MERRLSNIRNLAEYNFTLSVINGDCKHMVLFEYCSIHINMCIILIYSLYKIGAIIFEDYNSSNSIC
jgi:hypothetical protein